MSFQTAVEATPGIEHAYRPGLQALKPVDKQHITAQDNHRLTGSIDLDGALQQSQGDAPRWDDGIGHRPSNFTNNREMVYWVEIHPATDGEVKQMVKKVQWLKQFINGSPQLKALHREFIWVSSGKTSLSPQASLKRQLAICGLQHCGGHLKILDEAVPAKSESHSCRLRAAGDRIAGSSI